MKKVIMFLTICSLGFSIEHSGDIESDETWSAMIIIY